MVTCGIFRNVEKILLLALLLSSLGWSALAQPRGNYSVEINKGTIAKLNKPATTVVVANPEIADVQIVTPHMMYITGRKVGETSMLAIGENEEVLLIGNVNVTHNIGKLKEAVSQAIPGSKLEVDSTNKGIVLKGNAESPVIAEKIQRLATTFLGEDQSVINMMSTEDGDQVMLKVKIAEVSRTELQRFGINLEALLSTGNFVFGAATGRDFFDEATSLITRTAELDNSFMGGFNDGNHDITGLVDALEEDGLITVLAEPNLTAKSGSTANFLAGGEFPIPIIDEDGGITITYRKFGVSLDFTPVVLNSKKISLAVSPEVSSISSLFSIETNGFNIPTLLTRRATTTVELGSGESFAIAGLIRHDNTNDVSKVPGLGDIPVLGMLFRSEEFRNDMSELVIVVTPYIVKGTQEAQIAAPTDHFKPVNNLDLILRGKLYGAADGDEPGLTEFTEDTVPVNQARLGPRAGFIMR